MTEFKAVLLGIGLLMIGNGKHLLAASRLFDGLLLGLALLVTRAVRA